MGEVEGVPSLDAALDHGPEQRVKINLILLYLTPFMVMCHQQQKMDEDNHYQKNKDLGILGAECSGIHLKEAELRGSLVSVRPA